MAPYYKDQNVGDLDKLALQAKALRSRHEPEWSLNLGYYQGQQWIRWNRGRIDQPILEPHRVKITDNRIVVIGGTNVAKMTKQKPAFQVVPVSSEGSDVQAAITGEQVLDYLWRHLHMRTKLMGVLRWSRITGAGFWKIY